MVDSTLSEALTAPGSEAFVLAATSPSAPVGDGMLRQVLGHLPDLMMVRVDFAAGATGVLHHHPHRQISYVVSGRFQVTVGEHIRELGAGDCFVVRADVPHGLYTLHAGTVIDVFTPVRQDFLDGDR